MTEHCNCGPTCTHSPRFQTATLKLRNLSVRTADVRVDGEGWSMTCTAAGRTIETGPHPTAAEAVEELVAEVKRALTSPPPVFPAEG